ncbi:MAG: 16S rRNA (uracil(1498)-N(3))-methyltransferase [Actinomycetota bacterium]|nr:16S rRNA (uracil(1498)-N(3))-methyltransferase [Actinomycetota bacterium]
MADDDDHHLRRVLRLRVGDPLSIGDGSGRWRPARLTATGVEPTDDVATWDRPAPMLTVAFALTKGDKPELVVQKLTELGVDRIVPLRAARSVVRWDAAKEAKALERLRLVARAAAMQSHRPILPEVAPIADLATLACQPGVALADRTGAPPSLAHTTIAVGPEGGWDDAERALDLPVVALGAHVLRAETAAVTVGALWTALRDQLV